MGMAVRSVPRYAPVSGTASKNIETRKSVMLRNLLFAAAVAIIVAPVVMTTDAVAGSSASTKTTKIGQRHARSVARMAPQHRDQRAAHRAFTHGLSNDAEAYYSVRPKVSAFRVPGYVYVPGKGIVDEACNLPTSACPNEMREVQ
jgi:hypothetical protein